MSRSRRILSCVLLPAAAAAMATAWAAALQTTPAPNITDLFTKSVVLAGQRFYGGVTGLHRWANADGEAPLVIISDQRSAFFVDVAGKKIVKKVDMAGGGIKFSVLDVNKDGKPEYLMEGGGFSDVSCFDSDGNLAWKYAHTKGDSPRAIAADLDRNGQVEIYVSGRNHRMLERLDHKGASVWRKDIGESTSTYVFRTPPLTARLLF